MVRKDFCSDKCSKICRKVLLDKLDKEETRQILRDQDLFFRLMFMKIEKKVI